MIGEFGVNAGYVEELLARYRESPQNVDAEWRSYFEDALGTGGNGGKGGAGGNGVGSTPGGNGGNG